MTRIRLTQVFPFLTPIRSFQAKTFFTLKCKLNKQFHLKKCNQLLDHEIYSLNQSMINPNTGFDIQYQLNKAFNLQLLAKSLDKIIIQPNQVFSFNYLTKDADAKTCYKEGLTLVNDEIKIGYGGGLCQLSNMLYEVCLHSPLIIKERHPHTSEHLYDAKTTLFGLDATVAYGFADLQIYNPTNQPYQISIQFDENYHCCVKLLSNQKNTIQYCLSNENLTYKTINHHIIQTVDVIRTVTNNQTVLKEKLYTNKCEICYPLSLIEKGNN